MSCFKSVRFFSFNFDLIAVIVMSLFWVSYSGNMTSYRFFKMATSVVDIGPISIYGWDITTSGLEKQTSTILEFYFRFRSRPFPRNLHFILHQPAEFRPNRSSHCGNMTSYRFIKMAAAAAQYYFRFCICWHRCLQKVKVYEQTKFRQDTSIDGWYITTSGFEIQTSVILKFYFRFDLDQFTVICMIFFIRLPNFVQIEAPTAEIWRYIHSSRWRPRLLNTTSGFVFVDVNAFRRLISITKPNFIDIPQFAADI